MPESQHALKIFQRILDNDPNVPFYVRVVVNTNLQLNMSKCDFCAKGRLSVWQHGIDRTGNVEGTI